MAIRSGWGNFFSFSLLRSRSWANRFNEKHACICFRLLADDTEVFDVLNVRFKWQRFPGRAPLEGRREGSALRDLREHLIEAKGKAGKCCVCCVLSARDAV